MREIQSPENLFSRSFFYAIIGKFDDDREVGSKATGFEVASKVHSQILCLEAESRCILGFAVIRRIFEVNLEVADNCKRPDSR